MATQSNTGPALNNRTVLVVGGGLAGLACAVRLCQLGLRPVLIERRPFLGGRAFSFVDSETGVEVDNGQHVFVGACTEYRAFLKEIGARKDVRMPDRLAAPVLMGGRIAWLKASRFPGSAANVPAILKFSHLSARDRLRVLRGLAHIRFARPGDRTMEGETFDAWLRRHGQNDETIERFWNLIVLPALNDNISDVSAAAGLMLFQVALLGAPSNAAIGVPRVGLSSLTGAPAAAYVQERGGELRTGADVTGLLLNGAGASGVRLATGEAVCADAVIVALPAAQMLGLLPPDLPHADFFEPARRITTSPIVGVHIWYDRPVLEHDFVAVLDSPLQWVFNVTSLHNEESNGGQHIVISLSGAWQWRDRSKAELREVFTSEMVRAFPEAARAAVTRFLVVKMLDATFRVTPGSARGRLPQRTPVPNLFLAGDWTDTGWPSTMESAVRSGNVAAEAAAAHLGVARS